MDIDQWIELAKNYVGQSRDADVVKVQKLSAKVKWMAVTFQAIIRDSVSNGQINWIAFFARIREVYPRAMDHTDKLAQVQSLRYISRDGSLAKFLEEKFIPIWGQLPRHMDQSAFTSLTTSMLPEEYRRALIHASKPDMGMTFGQAIHRYVEKAKALEGQPTTKAVVKCGFCKRNGHTYQQCRTRKRSLGKDSSQPRENTQGNRSRSSNQKADYAKSTKHNYAASIVSSHDDSDDDYSGDDYVSYSQDSIESGKESGRC
ncbi:hypothetical protein TRVA0_056S00540 [Trichomonascus vanleenenianus]|uniref:uncharacterized protein n=1 Tax=Trichomonascus vanleenenianus TaxID=2268995 RepID=UPI003EC9C43A